MDVTTLNQMLASAKVDAQHPAVVELGRESLATTRRQEVLDRSARLAGGLEQQGLERGDRVVILAPNSVDWIISALGILHAGGVVVPLDTQMPGEDLQHALDDGEPRFAITTGALRSRLAEIEASVTLFLLDGEASNEEASGQTQDEPNAGSCQPKPWRTLLEAEPIPIRAHVEDTAALFYTSGTTGPPKGVPLTHYNIASNVKALCSQDLADSRDRVLVPLPFHHVYPFTVGILVPFTLGAPIIIPFSLVGPQIIRALREGDATLIEAVPRLYEAIWSALHERVAGRGKLAAALFSGLLQISMIARRRFGWRLGKRLFGTLHQRMAPRLRLMVAGGAALDPELGAKLQGLGWEVATGYGLSETSPILTMNPPERVRLKSAGAALPGVELRIAESEKPAQEGETHKGETKQGEILARGPNVFSGYWNLPEKTREDLDEDGWFHTGDVGWLDEDGYLYLAGRKSAMIVLSGGENVDPERVEKALAASDKIREAGILEYKDRLAAVVVPEPGLLDEASGEERRRAVEDAVSDAARELPSHHRPGELRITLDPLPRTRLGKLRRHKVRELFDSLGDVDETSQAAPEPISPEAMAPEDQQLLSDPAAEQTWHYLAKRFNDIRLTPDSSLARDLGIDSLSWVDLTLALRERAGIELDDAAISRVQSVRDLLNEAAGAAGAEDAGEDLLTALEQPDNMLDDDQKATLSPRSALQRAVGVGLLGVTRGAAYLFADLKVEGRLPTEGPYLLAPRHLSVLDPLVLTRILDRDQLESLYWAGWTGMLFSGRVTHWLSRCARILPIDPGAAPRSSLALAVSCLERGHSLVWFPEGQRSLDGRLQRFKPGLGLVLRAKPVPVVPVWIEGTWEALPPGKWLPKRKRVRVVIGKPIDPERFAEDEQAIVERVHDEVAALAKG
ncbi:AMP-binding protein [Vreelandella massiliensis]|uniref:AMP-binding protein n=1 Tax=Vreelandella massiliensis TaxID=1816686 RepID=UPI00096A23AE|nr:AMP-binding protein [Halomonas massiliensis]